MPPHNDNNNNNSQENSNNDKNSKNMASESSETLPALEEQGDSKLVPPPTTIQTENSQDGSVDTLNDNLGDVSLTPVASMDIQNNDSADGNGDGDGDGDDDDDVVVVDPWAQVATATATAADGESTAVAEGEGDATATDVLEKKTLGDRWGSFRNRWEQQWEAKKNAATPYTSNPDEPATAAISPPKNMDDDVMEDDTTANNKAANTNTSAPATGPFARFRSGAGANPKKAATVVTDPSQVLSTEDMASFRANRISMTLQKDSQDSKWGFGMEQEPPASQKGGKFRGRGNGKSDKVRIAVMAGMGLLEHAPFQVGDTLVSVNNQKCTHAETTIQELVKMEGGSLVTLLVETPQGNPNLVQAMVRKPSNKKEGDDAADDSNNLGIGFYTPAALAAEEDAKKEAEAAAAADEKGEEEAKSEITAKDKESTMDDDEEAAKKPPVNKSAAASAVVADDPTSKLLRINHIDANGLLAQSVLSQGDIVVAINATPCSQMTPEQAMELLEQSTDSVTIIAMKPPAEATSRLQRWKKHARRAGIAIGGGTMVGVGLIFIPTLPPPFGEVLIVGGVSVLGTEFEAPKRVMRSARDSLERAVGREGEPLKIQDAPSPAAEGEEGADGASETASTTTPTTTTDTDGEATLSEETAAGAAAVAPQKKTMGTRFKSFGRNFVLPFLDQVVGDRKEETKKEEESPSSPTAANPVNESTTNTEAAGEETAASVTTAISETSVVGPDPEESSIPNATPTTTDEGETAVSSSSS